MQNNLPEFFKALSQGLQYACGHFLVLHFLQNLAMRYRMRNRNRNPAIKNARPANAARKFDLQKIPFAKPRRITIGRLRRRTRRARKSKSRKTPHNTCGRGAFSATRSSGKKTWKASPRIRRREISLPRPNLRTLQPQQQSRKPRYLKALFPTERFGNLKIPRIYGGAGRRARK